MATGTRGGSNDATLPLISTDLIAGGNFDTQRAQVVKLSVGALGAQTLVDGSNPVPVVQTGTPGLPTGAATEATLAAQSAKLPAALGQAAMAASMSVVVASNQSAISVTDTRLPTALGSTTSANSLPVTLSSDGPFPTLTGAVTETAPATDTASSGLNGRLQRIAQRLTTLIAVFNIGAGTEAAAVRVTLPTDGTGKVLAAQSGTWTVQPGNTANTTAWKVDGSAVTQPVSGTVTANAGTNLNTSALALDATLVAQSAKLPATLGQKAMTASLAVTVASDQSSVPINLGSGTLANGQVAPTNSAATLLAARSGRQRVTFLNTGTVSVYIGIATVTAANGFRLDPGAAITLNTGALVQAITSAGTGAIAYIEEYA